MHTEFKTQKKRQSVGKIEEKRIYVDNKELKVLLCY